MPEQMAHQLNVLWCQEITVFDRTHISLLEFEVLLGALGRITCVAWCPSRLHLRLSGRVQALLLYGQDSS